MLVRSGVAQDQAQQPQPRRTPVTGLEHPTGCACHDCTYNDLEQDYQAELAAEIRQLAREKQSE